jgi:hypothetical protein
MPSGAAFLVRRSLSSALVILGTVTLVFLILYWLPGDPAELVAGENATPESVARIRAILGTDRPLWAQYLDYMGGLAQGDLGTSFATQEPVGLRPLGTVPGDDRADAAGQRRRHHPRRRPRCSGGGQSRQLGGSCHPERDAVPDLDALLLARHPAHPVLLGHAAMAAGHRQRQPGPARAAGGLPRPHRRRPADAHGAGQRAGRAAGALRHHAARQGPAGAAGAVPARAAQRADSGDHPVRHHRGGAAVRHGGGGNTLRPAGASAACWWMRWA